MQLKWKLILTMTVMVLAAWFSLVRLRIGGQTYLMRASKAGHPVGIVHSLLLLGADPNARAIQPAYARGQIGGTTPLMFAVDTGNLDAVRVLLDSGADLNLVDNHGYSALCLAVYSIGSAEAATVLIRRGARFPRMGCNRAPA